MPNFKCIIVLICLRIDGDIDSSWAAVWSPAWIINAFILFFSYLAVSFGRRTPPEGLEAEFEDDFPERVISAIRSTLWALLQIFVTLRMDDTIEWNWALVFLPWMLLEVHTFAGALFSKLFVFRNFNI